MEVPLSIASQIRPITSVDLQDWGIWTCRPTTMTDLPVPSRSPALTAHYRRDSFVLVGVPLSEGDSDLLTAFTSVNARTLGLSPAALQAQLISAERLRRRCPSGPEIGTWQPSISIRFVDEPSIVRRVLAASSLFLHFHAVEAHPYTLPTRQCYHCGMQGHMSRYCRGTCPFCGHQHPTRACPLGQRVSSAPSIPFSCQTSMHGTRPGRGTY